ncbi:hypothetical protein [Leptolyngbya sp. PCC 6406]|uniref:hypothetical protein n=1 Tax=Leptolyngbya sp. PCC 6406 TaxID=1173264 RepID=UPI0002AC805F|nr:hypothetical protein [Leptolyngbya sp. PCC 6406]
MAPVAGYGNRSRTLAEFSTVDVKAVLPEYVERAWSAGSSVALREFETYLGTLRE